MLLTTEKEKKETRTKAMIHPKKRKLEQQQ